MLKWLKARSKEVRPMWLNVFGAVIALVGCFLLFDSRRLVKKYFNFGEENDATKGMKVIGFILIIIGGLILI